MSLRHRTDCLPRQGKRFGGEPHPAGKAILREALRRQPSSQEPLPQSPVTDHCQPQFATGLYCLFELSRAIDQEAEHELVGD